MDENLLLSLPAALDPAVINLPGVEEEIIQAGAEDVLDNLCKIEIKNEFGTPHFVKHKVHNGKYMKIWKCGICNKEFGHQYILMRHLPIHTNERKFQCNLCGKAFRQMSTLSQHKAIHSTDRPYVCDVCQKTFNRISTLISHKKTHSGVKPHKCHICEKAFHQKGNLRNHLYIHTNARPYKCEICDRGFNQMSNLVCHKSKVHQQNGKCRFYCKICDKNFAKRVQLRNHEQYDHKFSKSGSQTNRSVIYVDAIKTKAMQLAIETNQVPFALFRPLTGISVMVKVLPTGGDKHMLVPATAEDLKKFGNISVTDNEENVENNEQKRVGSTVHIKIPVVATIIQQDGGEGKMYISIVNPGPNEEAMMELYRNEAENNFIDLKNEDPME